MSEIVSGPGGMTWTIGACGCGRTTWTVDRGEVGALFAASCECGERRELRLVAGGVSTVAGCEIGVPSTAEHARDIAAHEKLTLSEKTARLVVASSPEEAKLGPSVIDRTFEWWMEQTLAPLAKEQAARDLADLKASELARQKGKAMTEALRSRDPVVSEWVNGGRIAGAPPSAKYEGILVPVYRLDDECIDIEPKERGQRPIGHVHGMPAPGSVARVSLDSGSVWLMRMASAEAQAARDIAALDPRCPTKTVAEVAAERGYALPAWHPETLVAAGKLVEVEIDWGPPLRRRVTIMDDDTPCDFHVEAFDQRAIDLGALVEVRLGRDCVYRVSLQERVRFEEVPCDIRVPVWPEHPPRAPDPLSVVRALPGVGGADCEFQPAVWHISYHGGPSPTVVRQAVRAAFPDVSFTVGRRDTPASSEADDGTLSNTDYALKKLAEKQAHAKTCATAELTEVAECAFGAQRYTARAELLARAEVAARLPDIRDEWDNLPDAEPEGIVPRGAK